MYCTTSDVGRPVGPWSESWEFIVDGVTVGHVVSSGSHGTDAYVKEGYLGLLYGPGGRDDVAAFRGGTLPFRQAVVEQLTRQVIIRKARALGLTVDPGDIGDIATGYPTLDGMPPTSGSTP